MKTGTLIEAVIGIVVGLALFPAVQSSANEILAGNATGIVAGLVPLIPTLYILIVIGGAAAYVYYKR